MGKKNRKKKTSSKDLSENNKSKSTKSSETKEVKAKETKAKSSRAKVVKTRTVSPDTVITPDYLIKRERMTGFERVAQGLAFILLAVFPLLMGTNAYVSITEDKFSIFIFIAVSALAICAILGLCYFDKGYRYARLQGGIKKPSVPQIILVAYMLWAVVSALMSSYKSDVWIGQGRYEGLCSILLYGAVFLIISYWGEYSNIYVKGMSIMGIIFAFVAILQLFGVNLLYPSGYTFNSTKFLTTVGSVDMVGGVIAICIPVMLCSFVMLPHNIWQYFYATAFAMLLYTQLCADVDSSLLGIAIASVILIPFLLDNSQRLRRLLVMLAVACGVVAFDKLVDVKYKSGATTPNIILSAPGKMFWVLLVGVVVFAVLAFVLYKKEVSFKLTPKKVRRIGYIALAVIVAGGLVFLYTYNGSATLLSDISSVLHGELKDSAGSGRGQIWKLSGMLALESPIFGGGPGIFESRIAPYCAQTKELANVVLDYAHNDFIQIAACLGFVGLAIYVAFLASIFIRAIKVAGRCPMVVVLMSGVIGFVVYSAFMFSLAIVSPQYWALAGALDKCVSQIPGIQTVEAST